MGRGVAHAISPDIIEYYMCSMELLDSSGITQAFLTFPVMPNSIVESETAMATISKTNAGLVTTFNSTFAPKDISISGTFGRKIRLLTGSKEMQTSSTFLNGNISFNRSDNSRSTVAIVKTGYGVTKMLKSIVDACWSLDLAGKPHVLIFNNYAFNTSYVVEVLQRTFTQSTEMSGIWNYALEMRAVAPASIVKRTGKKQSLTIRTLKSVSANSLSNSLRKIISNTTKLKWKR